MEGLAGEMQHHRRILSRGIEHDRTLGLRDDLPHDVKALGLQAIEMGKANRARLAGNVITSRPSLMPVNFGNLSHST